MYIVGANPLSTLPDPDMVKESLDSLEFLVVQDMFMNETASMADIVLPAASFAEKDGSFTSLERRVQRIKKVIKPLGESRPDWMIISELAKRMGYPMDYPSPRAIMEEISLLLPSYRGIKYEGMEEGGHFWPCEDIDDSGTQSLYEDGFVKGSGRLIPVRFREIDDSSYEYPFWLIKGSDLYHFGNGTRTLNSSRLKSILPRGSLAINPSDAGGLNLTDGDNVKVSSRRGGIEVQIKITEDMPRGILFVPKFLTGSNILNNKVKIERV
ncbi:MAG: molybdopterin-dependent oxidoreductase, partial [Thermodesulfobacteriota bacterium]|nr:molybdopterin-dependent oxidoreductase [Thermodesulfobacteriota bacterium]